MDIPFSEAAARNQAPIYAVLAPLLAKGGRVLEVGSGSGQHAVYGVKHAPNITWQMADQTDYLAGLEAQRALFLAQHPEAEARLPMPLELDVDTSDWPSAFADYDLIYSANTLHIMSQSTGERFLQGLGNAAGNPAHAVLYGPFKYAGRFTSESNAEFDARLQARGVGSGIRERQWVIDLLRPQGFELINDIAMPANNQCLVFARAS